MTHNSSFTIGRDFKPSPQFKKLYYIYFISAVVFGVLWWLIPLILLAFIFPDVVIIGISIIICIPTIITLIFILLWISKYYDSITYRLTENEIICKRSV